ncbi:MAG: hypothetical protein RLZZ417_58 [Bacteroidota bacterium]|jgi:hypothetical protein
MKKDTDYLQDIEEIRLLMEKSSKFISLSGWAGIFAGVFALMGSYIALTYLDFNPQSLSVDPESYFFQKAQIFSVIQLALLVFLLAISFALFFTHRRAKIKDELLWTPTAKRLVMNMAVPLFTGGILILLFISKGFIGFIAPFSLLFYGLALYTISKFTFDEVKILGLIEILLGLISVYKVSLGLLFWAIGFGVVHIIYGIYVYFKYER